MPASNANCYGFARFLIQNAAAPSQPNNPVRGSSSAFTRCARQISDALLQGGIAMRMLYAQPVLRCFPNGQSLTDANISGMIAYIPKQHVFVQSSADGQVRRMPGLCPMGRDYNISLAHNIAEWALERNMNLEELDAVTPVLDSALARNAKFPYNWRPEHRHELLSDFKLRPPFNRVVYESNGEPLQSLHPQHAVFELRPIQNHELYKAIARMQRYMVPQSTIVGCVPACAAMLALQGKSQNEVTELMNVWAEQPWFRRDRVTNDDEIEIVFKQVGLNLNAVLKEDSKIPQCSETLGREIFEIMKNQRDPLMLCLDGHVVVLDDVIEHNGQLLFHIREPFTGSEVVVKDGEHLWRMNAVYGDNRQSKPHITLYQVSPIPLAYC